LQPLLQKNPNQNRKSYSIPAVSFRYEEEGGCMKRISTPFWKLFVQLFFASSTLALASACSLLQNQPDRSAGNHALHPRFERGDDSLESERDNALRENAAGELGFDNSRELTPGQRRAITERAALTQAEKTLETKREREQYYRYKPLLSDDRERLEFIRIGSYEGRARWLQAHGVPDRANSRSSEELTLIEANDIGVGMTKQAVRDSWGDPEMVEVAGNPMYGNERWKYSKYLSSSEGYQGETRLIYFEGGRVVGWEKH
jgi:hypothetical protein